MYISPKEKERFWSRVDIRTENECWNWQKNTNQSGFGKIRIKGKDLTTHRIAYEFENEELNKHERIEHTCGNRKCCNAKHIELTEHSIRRRVEQQNAREMVGFMP